MFHQVKLLTPGPILLPDEVLAAQSRQIIYHRRPEFGRLLAETLASLKRVFQTRNTILPFTASGTGGLEAVIANLCSPGDTVVVVCNGAFGTLQVEMLKAFGVRAVSVDFPWGQAADARAVRDLLRRTPDVKAVLITHVETSTGVRNDVAAIAAAVRESPALVIVDAVSSVGAVELRTDEWGIDVVVTASQKALMAPPGLALVSVSERAWETVKRTQFPRYYWSFERMRAEVGDTEAYTPATPAISVIFALHTGLQMIEAEGLEACFARHRRTAQAVRAGVRAMGLRVLADEDVASEVVTTVCLPEGVDANALLARMWTEHGIVLARGQGQLLGKVVRIGHMGLVPDSLVLTGLRALEDAFDQVAARLPGRRPEAE